VRIFSVLFKVIHTYTLDYVPNFDICKEVRLPNICAQFHILVHFDYVTSE